ncbi:hypothetical protein [uncultured Roseovarius sp.]|uniref:hypothetical protein n=1 Tax=uncultured Roseovarius sp. TaxID=293344 RepID=UPI002612A5D6|nr:hypothetical protein [uncultured Roseovarius sp.]
MDDFQIGQNRYLPTNVRMVGIAPVNQRHLALVVGLVAVGLPTVMLIAAFNPIYDTCFRDSISHFYYAPFMGSFFVGALVFIGAYLIVYSGEDKHGAENRLSSWAGIFAFGVALFPTSNHGCDAATFEARAFVDFSVPAGDKVPQPMAEPNLDEFFQMIEFDLGIFVLGSDIIHYFSAALLFAFLAWFAFFVFTSVEPSQRNPDNSLKPQKALRNRIYCISGTIIVVSMIAMILSKILTRVFGFELAWWNDGNWTFWFEAFALWAFGFSWMVKGRFLERLEDNLDVGSDNALPEA